jgi:hypothetical protein
MTTVRAALFLLLIEPRVYLLFFIIEIDPDFEYASLLSMAVTSFNGMGQGKIRRLRWAS